MQQSTRHCGTRLHPTWPGWFAIPLILCWLGGSSASWAQGIVHYRHLLERMAPGEVGRRQLVRGGPLEGYFQPVEISVPPGAAISLARDGRFTSPHPDHVKVGMLIGHVYRLEITGIPLNEGQEVYPTIEVIDRLYPPPGLAETFPIPIQLSKEELVYALNGQFVTRVVYLEDPRTALPVRQDPQQQRVFEVGHQDDPLQIADQLGRPMAILRMGSRVPENDSLTGRFTFGMPPFLEYTGTAQPPSRTSGLEPSNVTPAMLRRQPDGALPVRFPTGSPSPLGGPLDPR